MNVNPAWKDVFEMNDNQELDEYFESLGQEFFQLFERLQGSNDIRFSLSEEQEERFNAFFKDFQDKYIFLQNPEGKILKRTAWGVQPPNLPGSGQKTWH